MLTLETINIAECFDGKVLNEPNTLLFRTFVKFVAKTCVVLEASNQTVDQVMETATEELRKLGRGRLADQLDAANKAHCAANLAAIHLYAFNLYVDEGLRAGKGAEMLIAALQRQAKSKH